MSKKEKEEKKEAEPERRQVVIETDGDNVYLVKAEITGKIELVAILDRLIRHLTSR